jgi:hypothetical protein
MSMLWMALGGITWSASEYAIHRFIGHGPKRTLKPTILEKLTPSGLAAEFNAEHLAHHATPSYFAPTARKVRAAAVAIPLLGGALTPIVGPRRALSFATGFSLVYGGYEVLHRWIHTRPPTTAYGRWARRHHLLHHHKTPRLNHGVTSPLWDIVSSSHVPAERIKVPRHVAPTWMVDADGSCRPEFADDYELVGRARDTGSPVVAPAAKSAEDRAAASP